MKIIPALLILCASTAFSATEHTQYYYLPNSQLTPGVVETIDKEKVCTEHYTDTARHVTKKMLRTVYERYNVQKDQCKLGCKVDHLIPLAIGGSNDIQNLWPHEYGAEWTVYEKTRLEVRLRKAVCKENMDIEAAQACIKSDWTKCHAKFYPGEHEKRVSGVK